MLNNRIIRITTAALVVLAAGLTQAFAAPESLGKFGEWNAFTYSDESGKVCFVISEPQSANLSRKASRGQVFFMVTHWAGRKKFGEPSVIIGYPFNESQAPKISIGSDNFSMKASQDGAWIEENAEERKLIESMKAGTTMTVTGVSKRGTRSTDRYSLGGITAAMDTIDAACGRTE